MKRKMVLMAAVLVMSLSMTACIGREVKETGNTDGAKYEILLSTGFGGAYTFQDPKTGVWYMATSYGVTPRLNSDGSLYVTEN